MSDPVWLNQAYSLLGTAEIKGKIHNKEIMGWAKALGLSDYTSDEIPWCGLFVAHCISKAGIQPVEKPLWALNWSKFGVRLQTPCLGAVMIFSRTGGSHVGFYVGENGVGDRKKYYILGGNQSNKVSIIEMPAHALIKNATKSQSFCRWPSDIARFPVNGIQRVMTLAEAKKDATLA